MNANDWEREAENTETISKEYASAIQPVDIEDTGVPAWKRRIQKQYLKKFNKEDLPRECQKFITKISKRAIEWLETKMANIRERTVYLDKNPNTYMRYLGMYAHLGSPWAMTFVKIGKRLSALPDYTYYSTYFEETDERIDIKDGFAIMDGFEFG